MTETGLSLGTPHYMSPEQATADKGVTARSDVYSLASVLYEMLTGEPPHMGNSAQQIIMKIVTEEAQPVTKLRKSVPPNVAAALSKALEKLPADRFDTAKSFAEALASPTFATATPAPIAATGADARSRTVALVAGLAATAIVFAAVATWALLRPMPTPVARYGLAITGYRAPVSQDQGQLALAPDGSWLVYTGSGTRPGETQLWVKRRDRLEMAPLPGTTGAQVPSVSPDGNWIAFVANGQLLKIPAGGGLAVRIADTAGVGSPLWLDDGTVVYADAEWRLRRIPADGGVSEVVFTAGTGLYATTLAALPNGRGVLFAHCSDGCAATSEMWVADARSDTARLLLPDVAWAAYADGRLLFVGRGGGVFGAPFDLGTLSLEGAPVPLFDGVTVTTLAQMALSASGTMAYLAGSRGGDLSEAVWVSPDGRAVPVDTAWAFADYTLASWDLSPDGTRLAVVLRGEAGTNVWIKELDRGPLSRVTYSDREDIRPRWTPDGGALTYVSNRTGINELYQRQADGSGTDSLVLRLEAPIQEAFWSRDRQWIVLRTGSTDGHRDILAVRAGRDSVPRPLLAAPYDEEAPALSPDGRWLAYVSSETGRREVFVRPFPEVDAGKWQVSTAGGTSPVWAHSGRELFYVTGSRELASQAVLPGAVFTRGEQRVLFRMDGYRQTDNYRSFDVSPDDRRFLLLRPKGSAAEQDAPVLVVVENWLEEVDRIMRTR
jgi:serine/threonine-protein kinase